MDLPFLSGCLRSIERGNSALSVECVMPSSCGSIERLSSVSTSTSDDMQATCCLSEGSASQSFSKLLKFISVPRQDEENRNESSSADHMKNFQQLRPVSPVDVLDFTSPADMRKEPSGTNDKECSKWATEGDNSGKMDAGGNSNAAMDDNTQFITPSPWLSYSRSGCPSVVRVDDFKRASDTGAVACQSSEDNGFVAPSCELLRRDKGFGYADDPKDLLSTQGVAKNSSSCTSVKRKGNSLGEFADNGPSDIHGREPKCLVHEEVNTSPDADEAEACSRGSCQRSNCDEEAGLSGFASDCQNNCTPEASSRKTDEEENDTNQLQLRDIPDSGVRSGFPVSFFSSSKLAAARSFVDYTASECRHALDATKGHSERSYGTSSSSVHFRSPAPFGFFSVGSNSYSGALSPLSSSPLSCSCIASSSRSSLSSGYAHCNSGDHLVGNKINGGNIHFAGKSSSASGHHSFLSLPVSLSSSFVQNSWGNPHGEPGPSIIDLPNSPSPPHIDYQLFGHEMDGKKTVRNVSCCNASVDRNGVCTESKVSSGGSNSDVMWWRLLFDGNLYDPSVPPPSAFPSLTGRAEITCPQQKMMYEDTIKALGVIRPEWKRRESGRPYWWHRCNLAVHSSPYGSDMLDVYSNVLQSLFSAVGVNALSKKLPFEVIMGHLRQLEAISKPLINGDCCWSLPGDASDLSDRGSDIIDTALNQLDELAKTNMAVTPIASPLSVSSSLSSSSQLLRDETFLESSGKAYTSVNRSISTRGLSRAISGNSVQDLAEDDCQLSPACGSSLEDAAIPLTVDSQKLTGASSEPTRCLRIPVDDEVPSSSPFVPPQLAVDPEFERCIAEFEPGSKVRVLRSAFLSDSSDSPASEGATGASHVDLILTSIHRSIDGHQVAFRFPSSSEKLFKTASEFVKSCTNGDIKLSYAEEVDQVDPQKLLAASYASASRTRASLCSEIHTGLRKKFIGKHRPSPPGAEKHCKCKFSNARAELAAKLRNIIRSSPSRFKECCSNTPDLLHIQFQNARTYQLEILAYLMNVDPWKYATNPQDRPTKEEQEKIVLWYKEAINSIEYNKLVREWEHEQSLLKANAAVEKALEYTRLAHRSQENSPSLSLFQRSSKTRTSQSLSRSPAVRDKQSVFFSAAGNLKKSSSDHSGTEGSEPQGDDHENASVSTRISSNGSHFRISRNDLTALTPGVAVKLRNFDGRPEQKRETANDVKYGTIVSLEINEDDGKVVIRPKDAAKRSGGGVCDLVFTGRDTLAMLDSKDLVLLETSLTDHSKDGGINGGEPICATSHETGHANIFEGESSAYSSAVSSFKGSVIKQERDSSRRKGTRFFFRRPSSTRYGEHYQSDQEEREDNCRSRKAKHHRDGICSKRFETVAYMDGRSKDTKYSSGVAQSEEMMNRAGGAEGAAAESFNLPRVVGDATAASFDASACSSSSDLAARGEASPGPTSGAIVRAQVKRRGRPPLKIPTYTRPCVDIIFHQGKGRPRTDGKQTTGYWEVTGNQSKNVIIRKKLHVKDFDGNKELAWKAAEREGERISRMLLQKFVTSRSAARTGKKRNQSRSNCLLSEYRQALKHRAVNANCGVDHECESSIKQSAHPFFKRPCNRNNYGNSAKVEEEAFNKFEDKPSVEGLPESRLFLRRHNPGFRDGILKIDNEAVIAACRPSFSSASNSGDHGAASYCNTPEVACSTSCNVSIIGSSNSNSSCSACPGDSAFAVMQHNVRDLHSSSNTADVVETGGALQQTAKIKSETVNHIRTKSTLRAEIYRDDLSRAEKSKNDLPDGVYLIHHSRHGCPKGYMCSVWNRGGRATNRTFCFSKYGVDLALKLAKEAHSKLVGDIGNELELQRCPKGCLKPQEMIL